MARATPILLGMFFGLATAILAVTGIAVLWPGTPADAIWQLRPDRQPILTAYRGLVAPGFLGLAVPMALASAGCFLRKRWARWLAIGIFAVNGTGDAVQLVLGNYLEGAVGVTVTTALIFWLTRPDVKAVFA